jgi:cytochrome P450
MRYAGAMGASDPADPFGLLSPAMRQDPYPIYERLRREAPVYFCDAWGAWVLTRYDDVQAAFRDPRWSADRAAAYASRVPAEVRARFEPLFRNLRAWALFMDPPAHTRVRALLNRAFSPRLIQQLAPRIERIVDDLLTDVGREFDVVAALAVPLPVLVIGELLGLPREDASRLKEWSDDLAALLGAGRPTPALIDAGTRAIGEIEDYFRAHIAERRRAPHRDLLTALIASEEEGAILDEQELISTCAMVLFGGHETTTHLIGNGIRALAMHRAEWARLADDPSLVSAAIEEILRFDGPVQRMGRVAREPIELRGQSIAAGQRAFLMLGAANRDPETFAEPARFDIRRAGEHKHLAFGFGTHYCVGAALGRMEAEAAIGALVRRVPTARLVEPASLEYLDNQTIRGLRVLRLQRG